jgi:general secretion pathway protein C
MSLSSLLDSWWVVVPTTLSLAIVSGSHRHRRHGPPPEAARCVVAPLQPSPSAPSRLDEQAMSRVFGMPGAGSDRSAGDLNDVARPPRIIPAFRDGKPIGFKLFSIRPNSLYARIGIENGDVIRRVNGYEINSPEKALEAYSRLQNTDHFEVDLEHGGLPVTRFYDRGR